MDCEGLQRRRRGISKLTLGDGSPRWPRSKRSVARDAAVARANGRRLRRLGAVWIDSQAFDESLRAGGLGDRTGQDVIVYCDCPNEASAAVVAKKLMRVGFKRVRPLGGGIDAWIEKGYGIEALPST